MDSIHVFFNEVIYKYQIDKLLTPKRIGNGELENVILSDLRKQLDFCFLDIDLYTLKDDFLSYIEDFSLKLRAISIPTQKNRVKRIRKKIKLLETKHPKLDINDAKDEIKIEEINKLEWLFSQEEYILAYLREQKIFINNWVTEKRKEFTEEPIKKFIENERSRIHTKELINRLQPKKQNVVIPKKHHFYCQIGQLFAQNYLSSIKLGDDTYNTYFYKKKGYIVMSRLSNYIKNDILKTKKSVHQYIDDTLKDNDTQHNFYSSQTKLKNISQYCSEKNIEIINERFIELLQLK